MHGLRITEEFNAERLKLSWLDVVCQEKTLI